MTAADGLVILGRDISRAFPRPGGGTTQALDAVSLEVGPGKLTALVGPDGAGKTTLIRLTTGLIAPDAGELRVLGVNVAADPQQVQERIGYMPQRFGLYEDLTIQENLDLYADMHGVSAAVRSERYPRLMEMTALGPFVGRLAGRLSGGMKQKLGLACTLVRSPELLVLDEPTVGVDPLSRGELWAIIRQLVKEQRLTVLVSTSYLNEAEWCDQAVVMRQGKVLASGPPDDISRQARGRTFLVEPPQGQTARGVQARLLDNPGILDAVPEAGCVRVVLKNASDADTAAQDLAGGAVLKSTPPQFEDAFMILLRDSGEPNQTQVESIPVDLAARAIRKGEPAVVVSDMVRRFGTFTAVDHVSFEVRAGEIFGLLGPNGAGKTTTFRMLCGLLPATSGTLRVAGMDLRRARASARQRIGYVAQKFSLYGPLSVMENLEFFASAYGLHGRRRRERIGWAMRQFELESSARVASGQLPGGYKQRLAMAVALLHQPEILFLDEPTSGADPLARREFWKRITGLAEEGVTVIVTTHFMVEAEYCDRVAIMDAGRVLAQGTPAEIRGLALAQEGQTPTMEDAFIAIVEAARHDHAAASSVQGGAA